MSVNQMYEEVPRERRAHIVDNVDKRDVYLLPGDGERVLRISWTKYEPAFVLGSTTSS